MALYTTILTGNSNTFQTTSEHVNALAKDILSGQGFIGSIASTSGVAPMTGAFALNAQGTPDTTVAVSTGVGYVAATPSTQGAQLLRVEAKTVQSVTIASNVSGSTKYDWIYIKVDPTNANTPNAAGDNVSSLYVSRSTSSTTDTAAPPAYGLLIGIVTVTNSFTTITNDKINDRRLVTTPSYSTTQGWTGGLPTPNTVVHNGWGNYTLTFNSVDLTSTVSVGQKLRSTRAVAVPIQCAQLNGSNQNFSRASGSLTGITFTTAFTAEADVFLNLYQAAGIVSRYNGTTGWILDILATGQLRVYASNSGANRAWNTTQQIPLNKQTHVAAAVDLAAGTCALYINGISVPISPVTGSATSLTQAGNLEVGSWQGANFFPGKLTQVAVYSAALSAATIAASINQPLTGSETNVVFAASLSGATGANDLTTNGNNLTANNGVTTTNAGAPWGNNGLSTTIDFGTIVAQSFSTNTTLTVQCPRGNTLPTTGGIAALAYSALATPYGFPNTLFSGLVQAASNSTAPTLSANEFDLGPNGAVVGVYAPVACTISAEVIVSIQATSDHEFQPEIRVDGSVYQRNSIAAVYTIGRSNSRTIMSTVELSAGYHSISAGVYIAAGAGWSMSPNWTFVKVFTPLPIMAG